MVTTKSVGWLGGLRSALAEIARRETHPGPANSRIIIEWTATYQVLLAKVPEESLLAAYCDADEDRSIWEAAVLFAEIERRGLDP